MLERVRSRRQRLLSITHTYQDELDPESRVAMMPDLDRLLHLADVYGEEGLPRRQRFEALQFFDLARMLLWIEERDSVQQVGRDMDAIIDLFIHELTDGTLHLLTIWTYHDAHSEYRVSDVGIGERLHAHSRYERMHPLPVRPLKQGGIVSLHHRPKDPFETWLKVYKQSLDATRLSPFDVRDRRGLKLVAQGTQDVRALVEQVRELVVRERETIQVVHDNLEEDRRMDTDNHHSGLDFKAVKCEFTWNGRTVELLIVRLIDYFNSILSLSSANHELYRIEQLLDVYFPFLFPSEIYGVHWGDASVRTLVRSRLIDKLGWRISSRNGSS